MVEVALVLLQPAEEVVEAEKSLCPLLASLAILTRTTVACLQCMRCCDAAVLLVIYVRDARNAQDILLFWLWIVCLCNICM